MGDGRLFPRLSPGEVEELIDKLGSETGFEPALSHPRQTYAPLGGQPVTELHLSQVRESVAEAAKKAEEPADPRAPNLTASARLDAEIGWALHHSAELTRSEASHDDVWAWLTLVLLPDVALRRFPATSEARFRGGHRNVFRRTWWRVEVLGELAAPHAEGALGEDEYVGVFERVSLGREPQLARAIVEHLQGWEAGSNRSEYARGLTREILRDLAHTSPALWDSNEIDDYVAETGATLTEQSDGTWRRRGPQQVDRQPEGQSEPPSTPSDEIQTPSSRNASENTLLPIHYIYKGTRVDAVIDPETHRVTITDGPVEHTTYDTPSHAARTVVETINPSANPARNGWQKWRLNGSGDPIDVLRDQ